jgi:hypothetical protein
VSRFAVGDYLSPPRELPSMPRMPPIIIHTIAPIMSMQGTAISRKLTFAPAMETMTASAKMATQPHIIFIEFLM